MPDERYDWLCQLWKPPSEHPAYLLVTDIAGLVRGAAEGAGLGNAFLSHIQAVDGILHVVRAFDSDEVIHVDDSIDPVRDLETITHELCLKDMEYTERSIADEVKDVKKTPGTKLSALFISTMDKVKEMLRKDIPIRSGDWSNPEVELIRNKLGSLITTKPCVYLVNLTQADFIRKKNKYLLPISTWIKEHGGGVMLPISVAFEQELWSLRENPTARDAFLAEVGTKSALPKVITTGYKELRLIFYFTCGEKEVRCWTIQSGWLAPQAAGVIHSDMEKGFIKAEVVSYEDFNAVTTAKGMAECKAAGKYRIEGKAYEMKDADICHFLFNPAGGKK